ncbi:hypothetical protein H0H93_009882 [Arthromyces matolae]|nr:hypothetical protein H0H93_009882 [Arthromyces matolae]
MGTPIFALWLRGTLEPSPVATKLAKILFWLDFAAPFPRLHLFVHVQRSTMEPKPGSQVGGGPYGLRRSLKVTANASPEARNNAQRRHDHPDYFDLPDPSKLALENENPFLMGISDHKGPYVAASVTDDDSLLDLDRDTLMSLTSDAVTHYSGSSPMSEPFSLAPRPINLTHPSQSPTPANVEERSAEYDFGDDNGSEADKENDAPLRGVPGRRTDAIRDLMEKAFAQVDEIFLQLSMSTAQQVSALQNSWLSTHGITGTRTSWCKYEAYFAQFGEKERERVGDPEASASKCYKSFKELKNWNTILSTFDDLQDLDSGVTLRHRRRGFESVVKRLHKLSEELDRRNLDLYAVLVGNCVNEDASLGTVVFTPGLENMMSKHLGLSDNELIAFAKTEAFNTVAAAASNDRAKMREEVAAASKSTTTAGSSHHGDGESIAVPGLPANAGVDLLRNKCKAMLLTLFGAHCNPYFVLPTLISSPDEAGCSFAKKDGKGKAKASNSDAAAPSSKSENINLPYNSIPQHLAEHGFQLFNWPFLVDFPGYAGVEHKKGIKCLTAQTARAVLTLLHGLDGRKMFLKKCDDPDGVLALIEHRLPVLFSCPPPLKNSESHGSVLFANGTLESCSTTHGLSNKSEVQVETQTSSATQTTRNSNNLRRKPVKYAASSSLPPAPPQSKPANLAPLSSHPAPPVPRGPMTRSKGPHAVVAVGSSDDERSNPPTKATRSPFVEDGSSDEEKPVNLRPLPRLKKKAATPTPVNSDIETLLPQRVATAPTAKKAATPTPVNSNIETLLPPRVATAPTASEASLMSREKQDAEEIFRQLEARAKQAFPHTTTNVESSRHPLLDSFIPLLPPEHPSKGFSTFTRSPAPPLVTSRTEQGSTGTRGSTPNIAKRAGGGATERVGSPPKKPRMSPVRESDEVPPPRTDTYSSNAVAASQSHHSPPTLDAPKSKPTGTPQQPQAPPASTTPQPTAAQAPPASTGPPTGSWDPYHRDRMFYPTYGGGYFSGPPSYGPPSMYEWPPHAPPPTSRSPPPSSGFPPQSYGGGYSAPPYAYSPHPVMNPHYLHPAYGRPYDAPPPVMGSHPSDFNRHAYAGAGPGPFPPPDPRDPSANSDHGNGSAAQE